MLVVAFISPAQTAISLAVDLLRPAVDLIMTADGSNGLACEP